MMRLYSTPLSPFSAKVRIALAEKGLDYRTEEVPFARSGFVSKPAELFAINPRGEVPALVDGELALYDSTVIVEYLEERTPSPPLFPKDARARALCRQLEDAGDEAMAEHVTALADELFRKTDAATRDAARIARAHEALAAFAARLERALAGRDWLCGEFSAADVACFIPLALAAQLGFTPAPALAGVHAWLARTAQRPSVAADARLMQADLARIAAAG